MDKKHSRALANVSAAAVVVVGVGLFVAILPQPGIGGISFALVAAALVFVLVGALILFKAQVPRVGWVVSLIGLDLIVLDLGERLGWALISRGSFVWLSGFVFEGFLFLVFPTGRAFRGWRWLELVGLVVEVGAFVFWWALPGCETGSDSFCRPFDGAIYVGMLGFFALSVVALIVRYRRSPTVERLQMKWFLASVVAAITIFLVGDGQQGTPAEAAFVVAFGVAFAAIPASIALAVFRYKLYEIDRVVSRSVSYLLLVGVLGSVFFGLITVVSALLPAQGSLAVAGSTLAVAALFNPLRRRLQTVVDRRFNRSRFDAERVMSGFASNLRDQVEPGSVVSGWIDVVSTTMQPASVGVWVRAPALREDGGRPDGRA